MNVYTNTGLVKHAENALGLKTKYMWGGLLRKITPDYISQLQRIYGNMNGTGYTPARWNELSKLANTGYFGVDCVGMIKSYYWSGKADGGTGSPKYTNSTDVNAGMMYNLAYKKGKIGTMPEVPGLVVYSKTHPHVGIYIGNGFTIESTLGNRGDGVVKRKLDSFWEYWFECPFIEYETNTLAKNTKSTGSVTVNYGAVIRDRPSVSGKKLGEVKPGEKVKIIPGTDTTDEVSKFTYVRLEGDAERWIVESAMS